PDLAGNAIATDAQAQQWVGTEHTIDSVRCTRSRLLGGASTLWAHEHGPSMFLPLLAGKTGPGFAFFVRHATESAQETLAQGRLTSQELITRAGIGGDHERYWLRLGGWGALGDSWAARRRSRRTV